MGLPTVIAERKSGYSVVTGIAVSLGLHALIALGMASYLAIPSLGVEFVEPTEIEFGIVDGTEATRAASTTAIREPTTPPSGAQETGNGTDATTSDAGPRQRRDASVQDAGVDGGHDADIDGGDGAARASHSSIARATDGRDARMPSGANVALRFDFERIRGTPLAASIGQLLGTIHDFQAVLGESGLDPVNDLDQFVMTSRNPWRRVTYMYVGRLRNDESWARERVAALAIAKGLPAEWTTVDGIEVAPWHDDDPDVERVLGLLGDRYFVLAPAADIPLLRSWIATLADGDGQGASSALGLADGEIVGLGAENVPRYLREEDRATAPRSARASILADGTTYDIAIRADFPDAEMATSNEALLDDRLVQIGSNPAVRMMGLGPLLRSIELETDETRLRGHSVLSTADVQTILAYAQSMLQAHYEDAAARERENAGPP